MRPSWSGQLQISLVSFGISLFPATESASQISLHQIDRKTGERIRHQKVSQDEEAVDRADIIKGYEFRKGEYVTIESDEIAHLKIPSKRTLKIVQFVDASEIAPAFFEKPYFVVPQDGAQEQAFAVIQKALRETGKAGLGEVAFAGRERLVVLLPPSDPKSRGLMAYTLRYAAEVRDASKYFSDIKEQDIDKDQLTLAKELIRRGAAKFVPTKFEDDYEIALRELIDAKVKHQPVPREEKAPKRAKVINLMDALRESVNQQESPGKKKPKASGLKLVKSKSRSKKTA
ncbi:MAG: Ku protein [Acidobacteriaceae bacterium]